MHRVTNIYVIFIAIHSRFIPWPWMTLDDLERINSLINEFLLAASFPFALWALFRKITGSAKKQRSHCRGHYVREVTAITHWAMACNRPCTERGPLGSIRLANETREVTRCTAVQSIRTRLSLNFLNVRFFWQNSLVLLITLCYGSLSLSVTEKVMSH